MAPPIGTLFSLIDLPLERQCVMCTPYWLMIVRFFLPILSFSTVDQILYPLSRNLWSRGKSNLVDVVHILFGGIYSTAIKSNRNYHLINVLYIQYRADRTIRQSKSYIIYTADDAHYSCALYNVTILSIFYRYLELVQRGFMKLSSHVLDIACRSQDYYSVAIPSWFSFISQKLLFQVNIF